MVMVYIDKVFMEFLFFNELFQLLYIEFVFQKSIMFVLLVNDFFLIGLFLDRESGGKEIIVWYIWSNFFVIEICNYGDMGVLFVFV